MTLGLLLNEKHKHMFHLAWKNNIHKLCRFFSVCALLGSHIRISFFTQNIFGMWKYEARRKECEVEIRRFKLQSFLVFTILTRLKIIHDRELHTLQYLAGQSSLFVYVKQKFQFSLLHKSRNFRKVYINNIDILWTVKLTVNNAKVYILISVSNPKPKIHIQLQGRNHGKNLGATSAMVGRICPPRLRQG